MNKISKITSLLCMVIAGTLSFEASAVQLDDKKLKSVKRDLKIMTNIVRSTVFEGERQRSSQVNGTYIANQGLLFTIGSGHGYSFYFNDHSIPMPPVAPVAPVVVGENGYSFYTEDNVAVIRESTMAAVEAAMEMAEIQMDVISDLDWSHYTRSDRNDYKMHQAELKKEKRALEQQARKLEREVRDIERELRDAEFNEDVLDAKKDKEAQSAMEAKLKNSSDKLKSVVAEIQQKAKKLQAKAKAVKEKREKEQKQKLLKVEMAIANAVCDFGGGLRSLGDKEHISFNLRGKSDRIYVFNKKNIDACADGDIDANQLLEKAVSYSL